MKYKVTLVVEDREADEIVTKDLKADIESFYKTELFNDYDIKVESATVEILNG